jgi:hypothetical protein
MDAAAWADVLAALRGAFPVNPWLAALWLATAIVLAAGLVYFWRRAVSSDQGFGDSR